MSKALEVLKVATHIGHIQHPDENSYHGMYEATTAERAKGVAAFFFASLFSLGIAGCYLYSKAQSKLENYNLGTIRAFWRREIEPLEICHGTTALYRSHFQEHGISHRYPAPLADFIPKIRKVWSDHTHQIPKTNYWRMFEQRYDAALQEEQVAVSFSANPRIVDEYTQGARGYGGEWVLQLRNFISDVQDQRERFSREELEVIAEADALCDVMRCVPTMVVKIRALDLPQSIRWQKFPTAPIMPLDAFVSHVRSQVSLFNPAAVDAYLAHTVQPTIDSDLGRYEIPLSTAIPARNLSCEIGPNIIRSRRDLSRFPFSEKERHWLRAFNCEQIFETIA